MGRVFAIGDIHGCVDELARLLDHISADADDTVVFLGDYIDRGPAAKSVVDRLLTLQQQGPRCIFLRGNHEDMFLSYLGLGGHHGEAFLYNGGAATLRSYDLVGCPPAQIARRLPPGHVDFFRSLRAYHRDGDFAFVHAGIRPGRPLEMQSEEDLMWIREEFIQHSHDLGCTILFGHTPYREILVDLPYKIGLDTGLVYRNKLSCLETTSRTLFQIARGSMQVASRPLVDLVSADSVA